MKKTLLLVLLLLTSTGAYATQMCARKDTTVIPLDSLASNMINVYHHDSERIGYVDFDYGRVHYAATCLSKADIAEIEGIDANTITNQTVPSVLSTNSERLHGRFELYGGNTSNDALYGRIYCYCQITHPMLSHWVLNTAWAPHTRCGTAGGGECSYRCREMLWSSIDKRTLLFRSVW